MTQHLIEPHRFALPPEWAECAGAARRHGAIPDPRRAPPRRGGLAGLVALAGAVCTGLALCLGTPAHAQGAADVAPDLRMALEAAPMRATADAFVASAMAGERDATLALLSPALVARMGPDATARVLEAQILPFFQRGRAVGRSTTVTRTTDAQGARGFAFYQWLEARDGGAARPFTLYVVREQDRLVIANVVPDRLVEGRHR